MCFYGCKYVTLNFSGISQSEKCPTSFIDNVENYSKLTDLRCPFADFHIDFRPTPFQQTATSVSQRPCFESG